MSNKDLQRVTESVSYIGQAPSRRILSPRRPHITQKVKIAGQRTRYISVHDDDQPAEIFLRVKAPDGSSELISLYDVIARLSSLALQHVRLRRRKISSLEPSVLHVAPSFGTIASRNSRVRQI